MKKSGLPFVTLLLIFGSVACIPVPHQYQQDPNIEGNVTLGGTNDSPSSVAFFRCAPSLHECVPEHKLDAAPVENSGTFSLAGTRKFVAYAVPMAHCNWQWMVEFYDINSKALDSHTFGRYGPCVAPDLVKLECAVEEEGSVHCESSGI